VDTFLSTVPDYPQKHNRFGNEDDPLPEGGRDVGLPLGYPRPSLRFYAAEHFNLKAFSQP
jgi:hypothetical protein